MEGWDKGFQNGSLTWTLQCSQVNVHNIFHSESESPDKKKSKNGYKESDNAEEENLKKVADFVKKLEGRKVKYSQSRLSFQPSKSR